jgi:hypothetical protein
MKQCGQWSTVVGLAVAIVMGVAGATSCRRPGARPAGAAVAPSAAAVVVEEEVVVEPGPSAALVVEEAPLNAQAAELKIKKSAQVSLLCYHDFTIGKSNNPMVINIEHFRRQLQALRDARLPVISMDHYLAWLLNLEMIVKFIDLITILTKIKHPYKKN